MKKRFTSADLLNKGLVELADGTFGKHLVPAPSYNKYGVSKKEDRTLNGKVYPSKLEMQYRQHLDLLLKSGDVIFIEEQTKFPCKVNGFKICTYLLDFKVTYKDGKIDYVDVKGKILPMYRLKKKLVEALYPIKITEITKKDFKHGKKTNLH